MFYVKYETVFASNLYPKLFDSKIYVAVFQQFNERETLFVLRFQIL